MRHKLLLADDSVTIQRVIELTFADEDVDVTVVGDGRQAIERIRTDPPDIVLADIGMPERDGYEVAAFLKGDPQFAHIPVILLAGAFEPLDEDRARVVGCDGVLVKPFEPQMVINRVRELLSGRRPVAQSAPRPSSSPSSSQSPSAMFGDDFDAALGPPGAAAAAPATPATPASPATAKTGDALEDYFDRLDAAFANIGGPAGRTSAPPADPNEDLSGGIAELDQPPPARTPGEDPMAGWDPDLTGGFGPAKPHLASAFAALLAAEQGEVVPQPPGAPAPPSHLAEDVIEDIVQRVVARMTGDAVQRTVLDTAERLVREEIERIKREARAPGDPQTGR
jgi:CheY-like chemotaxis protein